MSGPVGSVAKNVLARGFKVSEPNRVWVTNITYIRTYDGFLYLAVVLDLFSRQVLGWATRPTQHADSVLQALLAAVWRSKPGPGLLLHSDQGTQFTSEDWQSFLREHNIVCSMSRRGDCHDNAAMESFFQLLKRERIKRRIYSNHNEARADVFQYIEMFYSPKRRHSSNDGLSPVEFEKQYALNGRRLSTKPWAIQLGEDGGAGHSDCYGDGTCKGYSDRRAHEFSSLLIVRRTDCAS